MFSALPEARASHHLPSWPADGGVGQGLRGRHLCRSAGHWFPSLAGPEGSWQPRANGACSPEMGGWGDRWGFLKQLVRMPGEGVCSEKGRGWTMRECPHLRARSWGRYKRDWKGLAGGEEEFPGLQGAGSE